MILNSWKEIASHLRCSVRTAQRMECAGMPVRRPAGHSRSAVVAFSEEIEQWLQQGVRPTANTHEAEVESRKRFRAEITALRARMAECRDHTNKIRLHATAIRNRRLFTAAPPSLQA